MKAAGGLIAFLAGLCLCTCGSSDRTLTCLSDDECRTGELCIDALCTPAECRTDGDCQGEERCVNHACVASMKCEGDDDCFLGELCLQGECRPGCRSDRDCPAGFTCLPNEGQNGLCAQCLQDTECNAGFICEGYQCTPGCRQDSDCPAGQFCKNGKCRAGCTTHEDCPDGFCDPGSHECVECQQNTDCPAGQSCEQGYCVTGCVTDAGCPSGQVCRSNVCVTPCTTSMDCDPPACLCVDEVCVLPPAVCEGNAECCAGYICNFGVCVPDTCACQSDDDCYQVSPDFPRCVDCVCVPECISDIDCPLPGQICVDNHCQSPACTIETCPVGQWCDLSDGQCKRGCDQDQDCQHPDICDLASHQCIPPDCCGGLCQLNEYCDPLSCQCIEMCQSAADCPAGFTCEEDGKCWCTSGACPPGTHCDTPTGSCVEDTCQSDADCPEGHTCNTETHLCEPLAPGKEGDACFTDDECETSAGLLCDSDMFCMMCIFEDPNFEVTFTCRFECDLETPSCPISGRDCQRRKTGGIGLCMP